MTEVNNISGTVEATAEELAPVTEEVTPSPNLFAGISKLNEVENCAGWVVREKVMEDGSVRGFEYGIYLSNDVFVSVPIHASLKPKMIKYNTANASGYLAPGYNYYIVPNDLYLAVSKYTNKQGKECPILVQANDRNHNVFIFSYACGFVLNSIGAVQIVENNNSNVLIVRKYIDKDRKTFAAIGFVASKIMNPEVNVMVKYGIFNEPTFKERHIIFSTSGIPTTEHDVKNADGSPFASEFISFRNYLGQNFKGGRKFNNHQNDGEKSNGKPYFRKKFNNPRFNDNKKYDTNNKPENAQ